MTFTAPSGYSWTVRDAGNNDTVDSDVDPADGKISLHTPATAGANQPTDVAAGTLADLPSFDAGLIKYNLKLVKTLVTDGPYRPGQVVSYTLTPTNDGPTDALPGWTITDLTPDGLTITNLTGDNYTCNGNTCIGTEPLKAGAAGPILTVTATITSHTGTMKNVAYITPAENDTDETIPLQTPTLTTDTTTTTTDNDTEATLTITEPEPKTPPTAFEPPPSPPEPTPGLPQTGFDTNPVWMAIGIISMLLGLAALRQRKRLK